MLSHVRAVRLRRSRHQHRVFLSLVLFEKSFSRGMHRVLLHQEAVNPFRNPERSLVCLVGKREGGLVDILGSLYRSIWCRSFYCVFPLESTCTNKDATNAYIKDSFNYHLSRVLETATMSFVTFFRENCTSILP